jgi:dTDP-4-amino-4,6-dideoxygalactose transaminase
MELANKYNLYVVEDAAQAIDNYYTEADGSKKPLGSIGHLAAFSFHETKNIIAGEGGMLVINDQKFSERAEIVREKGTNRSKFFRGEIDKYGWVDIGSSFLPSDIIAAYLFAQLENLKNIQQKRLQIWNRYYSELKILETKGFIRLPFLPTYAQNNGHMFYILCRSLHERSELIEKLKAENILSVFHYLPLHESTFFNNQHEGHALPYANKYGNELLRLPLYYELSDRDMDRIVTTIKDYFDKRI